MSNDDDWLNIDDEKHESAKELALRDPQFAALAEHTRTLTAQQRNFLVCYSASHYDPVLACERYRETFKRKLTPRKLASWLRDDPNFGRAIQMREELAARAAGVSAANVLSCLADIRRRNLGKDDRAAMQALELIGKHLRMFRIVEDQPSGAQREGPLLVVQINQGGLTPVNVTPNNGVTIDVPRPEQ